MKIKHNISCYEFSTITLYIYIWEERIYPLLLCLHMSFIYQTDNMILQCFCFFSYLNIFDKRETIQSNYVYVSRWKNVLIIQLNVVKIRNKVSVTMPVLMSNIKNLTIEGLENHRLTRYCSSLLDHPILLICCWVSSFLCWVL